MFRPFMRVPMHLITDDTQTQEDQQQQLSALLRLPTSILNVLFDRLDVLDRCTLALSSRHLLSFSHRNEHLDYIMSQPPTIYHLEHFFQRLARGWIPLTHLRYCPDCGKFRSIDPLHWRHVSEKQTRESVGRISQTWRARREDGWLRYWIERWTSSTEDWSSTAAALRNVDTTELVCPGCAVVGEEANEWRVVRLRERNERYGKGIKRVVSPGMNSPHMAGKLVGAAQQVGSPDLRSRSPLLERRMGIGLGRKMDGLGIQTWI